MPQKPGILRNLLVKRVALVEEGANQDPATGDGAHIMLFKSARAKNSPSVASVHIDSPDHDADDMDEYEKATLDAAARRAIPDSQFLAVWTDAQGKKHRKLPVPDDAHLTAAGGRIDGAQIPADVKAEAKRKFERLVAARHHTNKDKDSMGKKISDLFKSLVSVVKEPDDAKRNELLDAIVKDAEGIELPPASPVPPHNDLSKEHVAALKEYHMQMENTLKAFGDGPHPDGHPYHEMKAAHDKIGQLLKAAGEEHGNMDPKDIPADLAKSISAIEKRNAELAEENKALAKKLDEERDVRLNREMTDVLKSFKATSFDLEKDVARFRKMKEADPEGFERVLEVMRTQDAAVAKSGLLDQYGSPLHGSAKESDAAWAQLEKKAEEMVQKDTRGLTYEQALDRVMTDPRNNALVKQYREGRN